MGCDGSGHQFQDIIAERHYELHFPLMLIVTLQKSLQLNSFKMLSEVNKAPDGQAGSIQKLFTV